MKTLKLKEGKDRSLLRAHPWVFEGAIETGRADAGETVRIEDHQGNFLAWGAYSGKSKIRARIWSFKKDERIDEAFFDRVVQAAVRVRAGLQIQSEGLRLVHGESDGLPGLIVDQYADTLVVQVQACGVERTKPWWLKALMKHTGLTKVYERSDTQARKLEGMDSRVGWLAHPAGETPRLELTIQEHEWRLALNIHEGHKTGFYLDQRHARRVFADYVRRHAYEQVLNCYAYTGGFSVAALHGMRLSGVWPKGGQVISLDSSAPALLQAERNVVLNGFSLDHHQSLDADVGQRLRQFLAEKMSFDAIVLDPPKFAPFAQHVERAARAYKDINRLALQLLRPGGALFTFSCSGGVSPELFHKIVASAGAEAGVDGYILERLHGDIDHPMTLNFPEGDYLKGLVVLKK
jgi:23S rRNA (cytosine1962-C5)-methyltransferase